MTGWHLEQTYAELPQLLFADATPTPVRTPRLAAFNRPLATMLGLEPETLDGPDGAAIFAGNAAMAVQSCLASRSRRPATASIFN
jgi:uncharacterized protein YdiU (UPF0061 family)